MPRIAPHRLNLPATLCLYCGSSTKAPPGHVALARSLGQLLARNGIALVFGGGRIGLMGAAAEAALAAGGKVIGIIPDFLLRREVAHDHLSELVVTDSMHDRKRLMAERAEAFCILPGGLGTLDETFEILTWAQLGLHAKPIVLLNHEGYWDPLLELIDRLVANRYVRPEHRALLRVAPDLEALLPLLARLPPDTGIEDLDRV
ncbi:MAG TPA: TIGR00730 family Rossman fold protein [Kiloniellales bacterium]|nr:TIGR00730 family Rossman fold protein [Kiloniellales bacterium]